MTSHLNYADTMIQIVICLSYINMELENCIKLFKAEMINILPHMKIQILDEHCYKRQHMVQLDLR